MSVLTRDDVLCNQIIKHEQTIDGLRAELALLKAERDAAVARCAMYLGALQDVQNFCKGEARPNWPLLSDQKDRMFMLVISARDSILDLCELPLANPDPSAQELLRDRERLEFVMKLSPPAFADLFSSQFSDQMREAIDAAIAASMPATKAEGASASSFPRTLTAEEIDYLKQERGYPFKENPNA